MKIWLVEVGETLPIGASAGCRLRRIGILARAMAAAGHEVTWWASSFDHYQKRFVAGGGVADAVIAPGLTIRTLRGCGYRTNLSLRRLIDYALVARQFTRAAPRYPAPDVILSGFPGIELSAACVAYGRRRGIPVILDVKDMWPDIFVDHAPRPVRGIARVVLEPLFAMTRRACAGATAITGMTDAFVDWGVARARRLRGDQDRAFPFGYTDRPPAEDALRKAESFWDERGITAEGRNRTVCYLGGIGHQLDLDTVVEAARRLKAAGTDLRFVLCGTGDRLAALQDRARGMDHVQFTGWVGAAEMYVLMRRSLAGLDPLPDRYDFLASINNKAIEYFSAGLPVISSPAKGVLCDLLRERDVGRSYACGDAVALAQILTELQAQQEAAAAMGGRARALFVERFNAEKVYDGMRRYLESFAGGQGTP